MTTPTKPTVELTAWSVSLAVLLLAGFLMLSAWN